MTYISRKPKNLGFLQRARLIKNMITTILMEEIKKYELVLSPGILGTIR